MATQAANVPAQDTMSTAQFDEMMEIGLNQAKAGQGLDLNDAFAKITESVWETISTWTAIPIREHKMKLKRSM